MKNKKILFIDDDEVDRIAFERFITKDNLPFDYLTAGSVEQAKKILKKNHFDLIISDYALGDGTAFELFDHIRDIPIIIITGSGDEEIAVQAMKSGASDYIIKDPYGNYLKTIPITVENTLLHKFAQRELTKYRDHLEDLVKERTEKLQKEILERKKIEEALRKSETRYRGIVENLPVLICRFLPNSGIITFVNASYCQYFNKKREELIGRNYFDIISREDHHKVKEKFTSLTRDNATRTYEFRVNSPEGERWHRWTDQALFDENNNIIEYQAIGQDITKEKKLEQRLQQSQKMEAIGQLAGGIAHDFNNILTIINGYAELTLMNINQKDPLYKDLSIILDAGQKASDLTRKLLIFGRQQIIEPVIININTIIIDLDKMLSRLISEDIHIEKKLSPKIWRIKADPLQIEQIIINLIVNARDTINQKQPAEKLKRITIETGNIFIDHDYLDIHPECHTGKHIYFSISDNGMGIEDEIKNKIFEPFFSTKKKEEGTGLGLSTVYGIIKQNNATISVESKPGKGSAFIIYWPCDPSDSKYYDISNLPDNIIKGKETVLLVEDDQKVRDIIHTTLKKLGYKVLKASNGINALKLIKKNKVNVDLLISDIVMPEMGGEELADNLKKRMPGVKVLFTSGYIEDQKLRQDIVQKKVNFIYKPFSFHSLANKVRDVLDKH
jgi:two-component system cell cycle sensor histidine kinase/response regulator CckA